LRITTTASPSWVAWSEIEVYQDATIAPEHFGYYCSGCSWVGSGNYTAATSDHANLIWIADFPVENVTPRIEEAAALGMRSVVGVSPVFFSGSSLAPGYQTSWETFAAGLAPYADDIAAFYPMDEPDIQGFDDTTLATAVAAIKATFPDIPVGVIYSPVSVGSGNHPGLSSYDWVGIDCYSEGNYQCGGTPYEDAYYALRALLDKSRQRTFLVPQAGLPVGTPDSAADALALEIDRYVALAHRDLLIVGIVPFIYQTFNDGAANWNGLEAYPTLRAKFAAVGQALQADYAAATAPCQSLPDGGPGGNDGGLPDAGVGGGGTAGAGAGAGGSAGAGGTAPGFAPAAEDSGCSCMAVGGRGGSSSFGDGEAALLTGVAVLGLARARRRGLGRLAAAFVASPSAARPARRVS